MKDTNKKPENFLRGIWKFPTPKRKPAAPAQLTPRTLPQQSKIPYWSH